MCFKIIMLQDDLCNRRNMNKAGFPKCNLQFSRGSCSTHGGVCYHDNSVFKKQLVHKLSMFSFARMQFDSV